MIRLATLCMCMALVLVAERTLATSEPVMGAGLLSLEAVDPVSSAPMRLAAFYPSPTTNLRMKIGDYDIDAQKQSPIMQGKHPLIVISHGSLGGLWGHHDLASNLARSGFIVITLTHPGDNYQDSSGIGAISTVYGRPRQVSVALDAALQTPFLAPFIDKTRIAFIGFSAGGQTGLLLAGAKPDFFLLETYCKSHPETALCENKGKIRPDRPDMSPIPDDRIRAFVFMAPLSVSFPAKALKHMNVPVMIYVGENDQALAPADNAYALASALPGLLAMKVIPKAGHFVFLSACSAQMLQASPSLCTDSPPIDRKALHQEISIEITDFLGRVFTSEASP